MVFIIDSSGSIQDAGPGNWDLILDSVIQAIKRYTIGENDVRVGLTKFSNDGTLEIYLDDYYDVNDLIAAVRAVSFVGGRTNTADGLQLAWENVFEENRGDRPDVPNVAIVITDGNANEREDETDDQARNLQDEAQVIAIGITDMVSMATLEIIASDADDIVMVDDFTGLVESLDAVVSSTCPTETPSM